MPRVRPSNTTTPVQQSFNWDAQESPVPYREFARVAAVANTRGPVTDDNFYSPPLDISEPNTLIRETIVSPRLPAVSGSSRWTVSDMYGRDLVFNTLLDAYRQSANNFRVYSRHLLALNHELRIERDDLKSTIGDIQDSWKVLEDEANRLQQEEILEDTNTPSTTRLEEYEAVEEQNESISEIAARTERFRIDVERFRRTSSLFNSR